MAAGLCNADTCVYCEVGNELLRSTELNWFGRLVVGL
jgi:hypothetical protein